MFTTIADYSIFYYCIITFCLISKFIFRKRYGPVFETINAFILCILFGFVFGSRPIDVGNDTFAYNRWFNEIKGSSFGDAVHFTFGDDPIIRLIFWIFSNFTTVGVALGFISAIYTFLCYYYSKKVCESAGVGDGLVLFLITMYSFTAFNCEINIIRAGLGIGFWLLFTVYLFRRDLKNSIVFGFLAFFTHFSTVIFITIAIVAYYLRLSVNKYMVMVIAVLVLSFIGISILRFVDFNIFNLDKASNYTNNIGKIDYKVGFRLTFAIFNTAFCIIPFLYKKYLENIDKYYFRLYTLSTMIFFLWFSIPFSDRIGAFGWFLIPTVVYLPLVRRYGSFSLPTVLSCFIYGLINYCI